MGVRGTKSLGQRLSFSKILFEYDLLSKYMAPDAFYRISLFLLFLYQIICVANWKNYSYLFTNNLFQCLYKLKQLMFSYNFMCSNNFQLMYGCSEKCIWYFNQPWSTSYYFFTFTKARVGIICCIFTAEFNGISD